MKKTKKTKNDNEIKNFSRWTVPINATKASDNDETKNYSRWNVPINATEVSDKESESDVKSDDEKDKQ